MYFYNPRSLQFYQNGGAIAHGQHLQQIQVLQQQINNFNKAIANPDQSEIVEYNADGTPTGELDVELYHVWGNPADNARDLQENLLEKTNARLFLQNKLNRIMSHVQRGGATAEQEIQNLQQKIATLNQAIQDADEDEIAVYDGGQSARTCGGIGNPTGEVGPSHGLYYVYNDQGQGRAQQIQRIQQDKIDARDHFQTRLNQLQAFNQTQHAQALPDEVVANIMRQIQRGGATAEQEIQNLQQKIATLNQAIAIQNADEEADYVDGIPTGEVSEALHATSANQQQVYEAIQERKIDARDYFQTRLNQLQAFNQTQHAQALPDEVVANIMRRIQ